ncbi:type II toxin-antitoxin system VapC family toxin [Curtobacterium pusillum]|uniref:type II toxin-antitoxin system VapC family toxin n=1 Tax=Curtobacterium pusillum TaxID=69373 RepID=UPI0011A02EF7|nr:type II toxin-antitoxin system VapC family toxin [Curtobacterium pusillum]
MTRYGIDAGVALRIVRGEVVVDSSHQLVGPAVLRSHVLAALYREVRAGSMDEQTARALLDGLAALRIRLLGDRVSRATAWKIAMELGWDEVGPAEYLAVAILQADALVTEDPVLRSAADGLIRVVPVESLGASRRIADRRSASRDVEGMTGIEPA